MPRTQVSLREETSEGGYAQEAEQLAMDVLNSSTPAQLEAFAFTIAKIVSNRLHNRKRLLTVTELAQVLNVSEPTIYRLRKESEFPAIKIKDCVRFDVEPVIEVSEIQI